MLALLLTNQVSVFLVLSDQKIKGAPVSNWIRCARTKYLCEQTIIVHAHSYLLANLDLRGLSDYATILIGVSCVHVQTCMDKPLLIFTFMLHPYMSAHLSCCGPPKSSPPGPSDHLQSCKQSRLYFTISSHKCELHSQLRTEIAYSCSSNLVSMSQNYCRGTIYDYRCPHSFSIECCTCHSSCIVSW